MDLSAKPFYLDGEQTAWVMATLASMTTEEKLQQLFIEMTKSMDAEYLVQAVKTQKFGGVRYNSAPPGKVREHNRVLQENAKIPLIIACNTEAGGNGACGGGTEIGQPVKIGAAGDEKYAYLLGKISGIESRAVGCNCCFAPITDINRNWRNPIISLRSFGSDPDLVLKMSLAYMRGFRESGGLCILKHFPGDGVDERDQHLSSSVNSLSLEEWMRSFGKVYRGMIDAGVHGVMAGHILFPAWQEAHGEPLLPATLSPSLITGLLRGELGFNGLVVTDATHMVGLTSAMKRRDLLPRIIGAGCDMILFTNDYAEDMDYMRRGFAEGVITPERLDEAVTRILAFKACLQLHRLSPEERVAPAEELGKVGCAAHRAAAREVSDKAITLVKEEKGVLPLTPEKTRRILLVKQESENPFAAFAPKRETPFERLEKLLEERGFEVTLYESMMDSVKRLPPEEAMARVYNVYAAKTPVSSITDRYDLVLQVAHVIDHGTVQRISWQLSKGTPDIPWYVHELPVIFVSLCCPFHLADVPQVKTYINCYDKKDDTLEALVGKLTGRSSFTGRSTVDAFCGLKDTRL